MDGLSTSHTWFNFKYIISFALCISKHSVSSRILLLAKLLAEIVDCITQALHLFDIPAVGCTDVRHQAFGESFYLTAKFYLGFGIWILKR